MKCVSTSNHIAGTTVHFSKPRNSKSAWSSFHFPHQNLSQLAIASIVNTPHPDITITSRCPQTDRTSLTSDPAASYPILFRFPAIFIFDFLPWHLPTQPQQSPSILTPRCRLTASPSRQHQTALVLVVQMGNSRRTPMGMALRGRQMTNRSPSFTTRTTSTSSTH